MRMRVCAVSPVFCENCAGEMKECHGCCSILGFCDFREVCFKSQTKIIKLIESFILSCLELILLTSTYSLAFYDAYYWRYVLKYIDGWERKRSKCI